MLAVQRLAGNAAACAIATRAADAKSAGGADEEEGEGVIVDRRASPGTTTVQRNVTGGTATAPWTATTPTPVSATVPAHIRAANSPAGMNDRIPHNVDFDASINVRGAGLVQSPVTVEVVDTGGVAGGGGAAGTVTVEGQTSTDITTAGNKSVKLRPSVQTTPGNSGELKLRAKQGATLLGESAGFSVSAIPQDFTDTFRSLLTDDRRGFKVKDGWSSDSGSIADLDQAQISEEVQQTQATGCFVGLTASNSGYEDANDFTIDTHSTPASVMTEPGVRTVTQTCKFKDRRSGSDDIPMRNSGYLLTRTVVKKPAGLIQNLKNKVAGSQYKFTLTKDGAPASANGIASNAGVGNITKTQDVASGDEI